MWETAPEKTIQPRNTMYFLDWMRERVLTDAFLRQAEDILLQAEREAKEIGRLKNVPQSPPWHTEGPTAWHHVRRILAGVLAVVDGASLLEIEEFAREKDLAGEIIELEQTIRENAGSMLTYALTHDIAKPDAITLEAPANSKGGKEGFFTKAASQKRVANEDDRTLYLKLFRAFEAAHTVMDPNELCAAFFDVYEIRAHYLDHGKIGAGDAYQHVREEIGGMYHLSADDLVHVQLGIRHHMDFLNAFASGENVAQFKVFEGRANRYGLDADDFLDLLLAFTFIDTTIGSLKYQEGEFSGQTDIIIHALRSEYHAAPHRRARRQEKADIHARRARKAVLQAAELDGKAVFALLGTPYGPERGEVMKRINALIDHPAEMIQFGGQTDEMRRRIETARDLLTRRG